jgi:hypothetical protein
MTVFKRGELRRLGSLLVHATFQSGSRETVLNRHRFFSMSWHDRHFEQTSYQFFSPESSKLTAPIHVPAPMFGEGRSRGRNVIRQAGLWKMYNFEHRLAPRLSGFVGRAGRS